MRIEVNSITNREQCIDRIVEECIQSKSHSYVFSGPEGSGKEHYIKKLYKNFSQIDNITILEFIDDQLVCKEEKYKTTKNHIEINAAFYIGIALSKEEKNQSNLNYIVTSINSIKNSNIVIMQPNVDSISDCARTILRIITNNRNYIEKNTGKSISLVCSYDENNTVRINDFLFDYTYSFKNYSIKDINTILINTGRIKVDTIKNYGNKIKKLYDISNGNFNLVNIIYKDIFLSDINYSNSLSEIVKKRIEYIKLHKSNEMVSSKDLEDIILTCSLCVDCFNHQIISYSSKKTKEKVVEGFQIYTTERLIEEKANQYSFISDEIKQILEQHQSLNKRISYIELYNYLSHFKCDSYYERAFYLMRYYNEINIDVLSLFILSVSKSYILGEYWRIEKITDMIYNEPTGLLYYSEIFIHYINAFKYFENKDYLNAIKELDLINENITNTIIRTEVNRLRFKCYYYGDNTNNIDCIKTINKLKNIAQKELKIELEEKSFFSVDEFILRLQILLEISPCIIDDYNDCQTFDELYTLIISICRKIETENLSTFTTNYLLNIFNRKAFLFSNSMVSDVYYEEAKSFFFRNHILDEYCITLICYAGSLLFSSEFKKAVTLCKEVIDIITKQNIVIPTPEKLYNNLYIAEFLNREQFSSKREAIKYGNIISQKLYQIANELSSSPSKNVILTNVASLALYSNNFNLYSRAKCDIEESLNCSDVSNVLDSRINDFYRYHFAWFEIFFNIQKSDWDSVTDKFAQVEYFVPALFQKTEDLIQEKNKYIKELIIKKESIDSYDFCNNLVKTTNPKASYNSLYYRGLPLSDLQYTSYN